MPNSSDWKHRRERFGRGIVEQQFVCQVVEDWDQPALFDATAFAATSSSARRRRFDSTVQDGLFTVTV